jgi:hypothetical protein
MSNGLDTFSLPNENILRLTVECCAQTGEGVEVNVTRLPRIEAVDEVFWHASALGKFARRDAFARFSLLFAEEDGDTTRGGKFRVH